MGTFMDYLKMAFWATIFAILCLFGIAWARADITTAIGATCKITRPDGSMGTGCVFEISNGYVYVLTAGHVVEGQESVTCEFWNSGHKSNPFRARILSRGRNPKTDAAIIILRVEQFDGRLPQIVPLAPRKTRLPRGSMLMSVGCAYGSWETAWQGHLIEYQGEDLAFVPPPADGRSGSAVFDSDGKHILGIVRSRNMATGVGYATGADEIYTSFEYADEKKSQFCPTCPSGSVSGINIGGSGMVQIGKPIPKPVQPPQPPAVPWPTLPPVMQQPPVDLTQTNQLLAQIAAQQQQPQPLPAPVPTKDGPNSMIIAAIAGVSLLVGAFVFFATQSHTG